MPALQVAAVSLEVVGLRSGGNGSRAGPEPGLHRADDARGNFVLDGEDVDRLLVEPLRPELVAARDVGQLCRGPQPAAGRSHTALEDMVDGEGARDRRQVGAVLPRPERRGPGRHADPVDPHERVHDLLGHPLAEVFLVLRRAQVREWQHGDRDRRNRRRGGIGSRP